MDPNLANTLDPNSEANGEESTITKIKENNMYKSFFQDFEKLKKVSANSTPKITSFEEQKSFKQVFDYLSKESSKGSVIKSLETFVNFQSPVQAAEASVETSSKTPTRSSFFSNYSGPINLQKQYEEKSILNKSFMEALSPSLSYINKEITTNDQMLNFVKANIIESFLKNLDRSNKPTKKFHSVEDIRKQSLTSPSHPLVDIKTLPILLRFCFNSLTFDFNSFSTTLLLVDYIKKHPSVELYGFGLNIDCYNALLIQIWSKTENLSLISNLIDELKINAIQPDLFTFKVLSKIYLHCMRIQDGVNSEPYILWNKGSNVHKIKDYLQDFRLL